MNSNWKRVWSSALVLTACLAGGLALHAEGEPKEEPKPEENPRPVVVLTTSQGEIHLQLERSHAPITVKNFLEYVEKKHYDGTIFHRVIPGFMIQGGGMTENMRERPTAPPIKNEAHNGLKNRRGSIAMARTAVVDSATSQFFINLKDNDPLNHRNSQDYGYAVFGRVIQGMDVVDRIAKVKTGSRGRHDDVPLDAVIIESARLK
jgi:peptidyl-prolyl cis-trans isomerase A (cyclophilin A)